MSSHGAPLDLSWLARLLTQSSGLAPALLDGPAFASAVRGRMSQLLITDIAEYCQRIGQSEYELQCLASEVAVPETWFFRYPASFEFLRQQLVALRSSRADPAGSAGSVGSLEVASLGCATGVEAWCIAACALSAGWTKDQVKVHAIDRSPLAIVSAREGRIPGGSVRSLFPPWADPWIRPRESSVEIAPEVFDCVRIRQHDILTTADLFSKPLAVLFCRNVMIYLDASARIVLRNRMLDWLAPDGLIFLGHADGLARGSVLEMAGPPAAFCWRRSTKTIEVPSAKAPPRAPLAVVPVARKPTSDRVAQPHRRSDTPSRPIAVTAEMIQPMIVAREFDRARKAIEAGLAMNPANTELLELLAGIFSAQNELVRASQTYARLVYLEPNHGPALLALAELSDALGRTDDAVRYRARMKRLGDV